jgi:hypothetical protein
MLNPAKGFAENKDESAIGCFAPFAMALRSAS